jgi:chromosome segregation ATPase
MRKKSIPALLILATVSLYTSSLSADMRGVAIDPAESANKYKYTLSQQEQETERQIQIIQRQMQDILQQMQHTQTRIQALKQEIQAKEQDAERIQQRSMQRESSPAKPMEGNRAEDGMPERTDDLKNVEFSAAIQDKGQEIRNLQQQCQSLHRKQQSLRRMQQPLLWQLRQFQRLREQSAPPGAQAVSGDRENGDPAN